MPINSTTTDHEGIAGDHKYAVVTLYLGDLSEAGTESYDAATNHNINPVWGGSVLDQDNSTIDFGYDTSAANITATTGGATVEAGADVGNVTFKFQGNPSA